MEPATGSTPIIQARRLFKRYAGRTDASVTALENVDFEIRDGEFVCVVGPSGCG